MVFNFLSVCSTASKMFISVVMPVNGTKSKSFPIHEKSFCRFEQKCSIDSHVNCRCFQDNEKYVHVDNKIKFKFFFYGRDDISNYQYYYFSI